MQREKGDIEKDCKKKKVTLKILQKEEGDTEKDCKNKKVT